MYGWGVAANLIAQTISKTDSDDLKHIDGVILLGMSNANEEINIDNNIINLFRVPVFMVFGEKSVDFKEENLEKLISLVTERSSEIRMDDRKVIFHSMVVPCSDNMLRMYPEDRINRFALTKQAVDHATIDKVYEFCKSVLGNSDKEENEEKISLKKSFSTPANKSNTVNRINPSLSPPSSQKYKSVVSALTDLEYLEENENKQENKNKISFDLSNVSKKNNSNHSTSGISSIPMPHPNSDNISPTGMPKPLITPSRTTSFITPIKRPRLSLNNSSVEKGSHDETINSTDKVKKPKARTVLQL